MRLLISMVFYLTMGLAFGQISINEASNSNGSNYILANGSSPDWIELYNSGVNNASLQGLFLSDNRQDLQKWSFPPYSIGPFQFLTLLATGNGATYLVNHFETAIDNSHIWDYTLPMANIPNWTNTAFSTAGWQQGKMSIGYGDGDDSTVIAGPQTTVYSRVSFNVANINDIVKAILDIDYDDGFVAYLNGVEIARIGLTGTPPNFDELAQDHEAQLYQGGTLTSLDLDMGIVASALVNGTNVLALEVHNASATSSDLTGNAFLTFGFGSGAQQFNGTTHPLFNNAVGGQIETNFRIATQGETLYLSNATTLLDSLVVPNLEPNMSFGKSTDGLTPNVIFPFPTPNASNNSTVGYLGYEPIPLIQMVGGVYNQSINVTIQNQSQSGGILRYTLDGEDPDTNSTLYVGPVLIDTNHVLKVRCFPTLGNLLPSEIEAETFLFYENSTIPIISLTIDMNDLVGPTGIFDNWWTDWKRPCFIEYFDTLGVKKFESKASVKPDGGAGGSRSNPQHSVTVEPANNTFGTGEPIHYPIIPEKPYVDDYYALYLRNGSNFWNQYHQRDATFMRVMRKTNVNSQAYQPANVFINGQYFGVYEMREKANEGYFSENYGNHLDSLDLLSVSYWYGMVLRTVKGSDSSFFNMINFISNYDKSDPNYLKYCDQKLDTKNYTDYLIGENWYGNTDWIYNNMKMARARTFDNRWRFFLQDVEWGLGGWTDYNANMFDWFQYSNQPNPYYTIYSHLIQDSTFKNYFINRFADLMNTTLHQNTYTPIVQQMYNQLLPEMPKHFALWTGDIPGGMNTYTYNRDVILGQFNNRNNVVRNQILNYYSLPNKVNVTLKTEPQDAGYIQISTIIPDSLPWTGVYFNGNPVRISAHANPGFTFDHWEYNINLPPSLLNDPTVVVNIASSDYFNAIFTGSPADTTVTISEIHYNPDPSVDGGNWIELHNYGNAPIDLTGYQLKSSDFYDHYDFPTNTVLPALGYLVIAQDTVKFKLEYPTVTNVIGNTSFGWENNGDSIYVFDPRRNTIIAMQYNNQDPFPKCADGYGRTMENLYPETQSLDSLSWNCGCIGGSPGEAYFPCMEELIVSEFNLGKLNINHNAEDWIEIKNTGNTTINLNGFILKDEKSSNVYPLDGAILNPGEFVVIVKDSVLFHDRHKDFVGQILYQLPFGFSRNDAIRIFQYDGKLVQCVIYDTLGTWPGIPFSTDFTFEYYQDQQNQTLGSHWFVGCEGGSPGRDYSECPLLPDDTFAWIYPNPTENQITINVDNVTNPNALTVIEIYDLSDQLVMQKNLNLQLEAVESNTLDVTFLRKSLYLLKIVKGEQNVVLPFVKI